MLKPIALPETELVAWAHNLAVSVVRSEENEPDPSARAVVIHFADAGPVAAEVIFAKPHPLTLLLAPHVPTPIINKARCSGDRRMQDLILTQNEVVRYRTYFEVASGDWSFQLERPWR